MPYCDLEKRRAYHREYTRKHKERDKEKRRATWAKYRAKMRTAPDFELYKADRAAYLRNLRTTRTYFATNRANFFKKKSRAAKAGLPSTLTREDILDVWPEDDCCPVFGVRFHMSGGRSPWNASVDRIIPSLGYARGNIRIISHRANTIKNDASLSDLRAVVAWLEKQSVE